MGVEMEDGTLYVLGDEAATAKALKRVVSDLTGKKIKVTGPNDKDFSFDLDKDVSMKGNVAVGQRVKVQYTKGDMGNHVTVVSLMKSMKSKRARKAA